MEEICVGEYVRTKKGIIGKIEQIGNSLYWLEDGSPFNIQENSNKHSKNIIDLIEVGDIIRILLNEKTGETAIFCFESQKQIDILNEKNCHIIKSIVTKEQFASLEYKVKEE